MVQIFFLFFTKNLFFFTKFLLIFLFLWSNIIKKANEKVMKE